MEKSMKGSSLGFLLGLLVAVISCAGLALVAERRVAVLTQERDQLKAQLAATYASQEESPVKIRENIISRAGDLLALHGKRYFCIVKSSLNIPSEAKTRIGFMKKDGWGHVYPISEGANVAVFEDQGGFGRFTTEYRCAPCHEWKFVELSLKQR